ncbi:MAG: type III-A CRISPR-associated RAMP protein Csm3 [Leptospiraceae bacterium]|nr:type III-A CRISPR-associated RAMP protein Csm3 [Leptospiraceae bacterium]
MTLKLLSLKKITGYIQVESGLHIGASKESIEIGGVDNPIIKNPKVIYLDTKGKQEAKLLLEPYIPGSSLKGKMRSMLEWKFNEFDGEGNVKKEPDKNSFIARIFGHPNKKLGVGPTRLVIRDSFLEAQQSKELNSKGIELTEIKYENSINRITALAVPRPVERAISGLKFDLEIIYKIFDFEGDGGKTDKDNYQYVKQALKLVELDSLGGGGSRGSGKVKFYLQDDEGNIDLEKVELK